jgi:hypothetical protein
MSQGDYYQADTGTDGIADGSSLTVNPRDTGVPAARIEQYSGSASAEVYFEVDPDEDGTYEISVLIDSFSGAFHVENAATRVNPNANERLRIENASGGSADFTVNGVEIDGTVGGD